MKKPKISIGIEIEMNSRDGISWDTNRWSLDNEHCGFELRSIPCKSPTEIRGLIKSIKKMGQDARTTFDNTGTHIHIDFLNDSNVSTLDLIRLQSVKRDNGTWDNALGTGKRFIWVSDDGTLWSAPKVYMAARAAHISPIEAYGKPGRYAESVRRFFLLGKRFSDVLFGLQHPSRRFNKYCHSIEGWNETILMSTSTVQEICESSKLLQMHRRHMFNALSFRKFGTIEIRMIQGSLDYREIWEQVYLFGKMAQLSKSNDDIPKSTGNIAADLLILMGACGIHGKMRRRLNMRRIKQSSLDISKWTARCYNCERIESIENISDYGLSRPMCATCVARYIFCSWCGYNSYREGNFQREIDKKIPGGRYICGSCEEVGAPRILKSGEKDGSLWIMGTRIGCGTDKNGPTALRRMRKAFG